VRFTSIHSRINVAKYLAARVTMVSLLPLITSRATESTQQPFGLASIVSRL
jgi:hypothetical protein